MYTYFFILATELTNLNLKTNERCDPYLNFDYLQLALPTGGFYNRFYRTLITNLEFWSFYCLKNCL